jgi:hypothetical protein
MCRRLECRQPMVPPSKPTMTMCASGGVVSGIEWGTVPAWASAILTSGSLTLGFYVLLRDRRKEERTEASLIVCWRVWNNETYVTHIYNASKRTIVDVNVLVRFPSDRQKFSWESFPGPSVLRPEEEQFIRTPRSLNGTKLVPEFVTFQDADGIFWVRDLPGGQLKRLRTTRAERGSAIDVYARRYGPRRLRGIRNLIVRSGRSETVDS